jgi:hypothetical protein
MAQATRVHPIGGFLEEIDHQSCSADLHFCIPFVALALGVALLAYLH